MNKIKVAYVADKEYEPLLVKSINSVKRYNKGVEFFIICREELDIPGVNFYTMKPRSELFKYKPNDRMKEGVYYKFYLPALPVDKVLYLDCDVICQRPLDQLWEEKCDFICATESHRFGKKQAFKLGLPKYALTGMMLMNLKELRKANFTQRCLDRLSKENPDQHDETIINLEFNDRIRFIDKKYNYCKNRIYDNPIYESDAYLLHYVGRKQKKEMLKLSDFESLGVLKNLLKGKNIAIVGNSNSLLTKKQASEIDSHDIVIRFNKGFPSKKVGFKTDILFLACSLTHTELERFGKVYTVKRSKLCANDCDFAISTPDRVSFAQASTQYVRSRGGMRCQASTGFLAINFVLGTDYKNIDLYGFDFFAQDTYYNPAGYQTLHNGDKEAEKVLEYEESGLLNIH